MPDIREDQHPKIWSVLFCKDKRKRLEAIDLLSRVNQEWPVPWFSLLLSDPDFTISNAAYNALKNRGKAVLPLLSLQRLSPQPKVRQASVRLIGEYGDLSDIRDALASLFDPAIDVREEGRKSVEAMLARALSMTAEDEQTRCILRELMGIFAVLASCPQRNVRAMSTSGLLSISTCEPDEFWNLFTLIDNHGRSAIELEIISHPTPNYIDLLYHGLLCSQKDASDRAMSVIERLLSKDTISEHVGSVCRISRGERIHALELLHKKGILNQFLEYFPWVKREMRIPFLRLFKEDFGEMFFPFHISLIDNPNPQLILAVIENTLTFAREVPYSYIQQLLKHPSPPVCRAGIHYLLYRGNYTSIKDLLPLLKSTDGDVVKLAMKTIGRIARDYLIDYYDQMTQQERRNLSQIMNRIDPNFVESLVEILAGLDEDYRLRMISILQEFSHNPVAQDAVGYLLSDPNERVRSSAIHGLAQIAPEKLDDLSIERLFRDPDPRVRANLIEFLPARKRLEWIDLIAKSTQSEAPRERANAIRALLEAGRSEHEITLLQMLKHPNSWMRASGLWVLGRIDAPHLMYRAMELCDDPAPHVRTHALRAISRKGSPEQIERRLPEIGNLEDLEQ